MNVRDRQQGALQGANPCGAEPVFLDGPQRITNLTEIPDAQRLIGYNHDRTEHVLDRLLGGKGERDPAQSQTRNDRCGINSHRLEDSDHTRNSHQRFESSTGEV